MDAIETVAVLGSGEGGAAWALLCALCRCAVRLHDPSPETLEVVATSFREKVDHAAGAGALTRGERQRVLDGVIFTHELEEAATAADLLVDADEAAGPVAWPTLQETLRASAIVAAAAARAPAVLASRLSHPGRILGLRLVRTPGPLHRVALQAGPATAPHALARARKLVDRLNRAAGFPERG